MLSTDFTDFLLRIGGVRALVSGSVKSGKSVDNKKRVLSLAETRSHFVLSTDFTDFTDFLLRETWEFFYLLILLILLILATRDWDVFLTTDFY